MMAVTRTNQVTLLSLFKAKKNLRQNIFLLFLGKLKIDMNETP